MKTTTVATRFEELPMRTVDQYGDTVTIAQFASIAAQVQSYHFLMTSLPLEGIQRQRDLPGSAVLRRKFGELFPIRGSMENDTLVLQSLCPGPGYTELNNKIPAYRISKHGMCGLELLEYLQLFAMFLGFCEPHRPPLRVASNPNHPNSYLILLN